MGKLFKAVVAAAAIGSVCYVFKDKIKATKAYQTLGVDEKVEKVKTTIKDKMPVKDEGERDYFTLNNDEPVSENNSNEAEPENDIASSEVSDTDVTSNSVESAAAETVAETSVEPAHMEPVATDTTSASDVSAKVDNLLSDIPEININNEDL
ncbi:MAG: hypothetical protein ACI4EF_13390 [Coprococcus sp.]